MDTSCCVAVDPLTQDVVGSFAPFEEWFSALGALWTHLSTDDRRSSSFPRDPLGAAERPGRSPCPSDRATTRATDLETPSDRRLSGRAPSGARLSPVRASRGGEPSPETPQVLSRNRFFETRERVMNPRLFEPLPVPPRASTSCIGLGRRATIPAVRAAEVEEGSRLEPRFERYQWRDQESPRGAVPGARGPRSLAAAPTEGRAEERERFEEESGMSKGTVKSFVGVAGARRGDVQ